MDEARPRYVPLRFDPIEPGNHAARGKAFHDLLTRRRTVRELSVTPFSL
jgi:hypothetical protein